MRSVLTHREVGRRVTSYNQALPNTTCPRTRRHRGVRWTLLCPPSLSHLLDLLTLPSGAFSVPQTSARTSNTAGSV